MLSKRKMIEKIQFAKDYWHRFGTKRLLGLVYKKLADKFRGFSPDVTKAKYILAERFLNASTVKHIHVENENLRVNLVTDHLLKGDIYGDAATSLILATLFAKKTRCGLRVITRDAPVSPKEYYSFLKTVAIDPPGNVEFFSDAERKCMKKPYHLEISPQDVFIATSWQSSRSIDSMNRRERYFYLLQEVESCFYTNNEEQVFLRQELSKPHARYLINSKLLRDYCSQKGLYNLEGKNSYFEPAFPEHLFSCGNMSFEQKEKYNLFFYARKDEPRNLFYIGIRLIDQAIDLGVIDPKKWTIYFGGANISPINFSEDVKTVYLQQMGWREYGNFINSVDLAIAFMNASHPSYPPLYFAASGGVVLTNRCENKVFLPYSENIVMSCLDEPTLLSSLKNAIKLAENPRLRKENYLKNTLERSWESSLQETLTFMSDNL